MKNILNDVLLVGGYGVTKEIRGEKRFIYDCDCGVYTVDEVTQLGCTYGVEDSTDVDFDCLNENEKADLIERYMQDDGMAKFTKVFGKSNADNLKNEFINDSLESVCDALNDKYVDEIVSIIPFDFEVIQMLNTYLNVDDTDEGLSNYPLSELDGGFSYYINGFDCICVEFEVINNSEIKIMGFSVV